MNRARNILLAILFVAFAAAVTWQLFSRFAGGPMHRDTGQRRPADSAFFAPHE